MLSGIAIIPLSANGQGEWQAKSLSAIDTAKTRDTIGIFPIFHSLDAIPSVMNIGSFTRGRGGDSITTPVTALRGLLDVRSYSQKIDIAFPVSRNEYPTDSLRQLQLERARAWMIRLSGALSNSQTHSAREWDRLALMKLAASSGNDSIARQLADAQLSRETENAARSYILAEYIGTLADRSQDSARLVRNLAVAERYLTQLLKLSKSRYGTRNDSVNVLYRKWQSEHSLILAYGDIGDSVNVISHLQRLWDLIPELGVREREEPLFTSYLDAVRALLQMPQGRALVLALATPFRTAAAHAGALPSHTDVKPHRAREPQPIEVRARNLSDDIAEWLHLEGTLAPPIAAHAWFNTPDSLYQVPPRTRSMADGKIHVLMFRHTYLGRILPVLDRVQRAFPSGVETDLVMQTSGTAGAESVEPPAETEWHYRYLVGVRKITKPVVAVWAGDKVPAGYVPEGYYSRMLPAPAPFLLAYKTTIMEKVLNWPCVVIDDRGVIRFFQETWPRTQEAVLHRRIQQLLEEVHEAR